MLLFKDIDSFWGYLDPTYTLSLPEYWLAKELYLDWGWPAPEAVAELMLDRTGNLDAPLP